MKSFHQLSTINHHPVTHRRRTHPIVQLQQRSRLPVLMKSDLTSANARHQRLSKSAQHLALLLSSGKKQIVVWTTQQSLPLCNRGMRHHFKQRARGKLNKPCKFGTRRPRTTLCDICRDRHSGAPHLIRQSEALCIRKPFGERVNLVRKRNCLIPDVELLEVEHRRPRYCRVDQPSTINHQPSSGSLNHQLSTLN